MVRAEARSLASGLAERLAGRPVALASPPGWRPGGGRRRRSRRSWRSLEEPTEPGAHAALARLYADGDLVYTASSMPIRDQEAFVPSAATQVRFLCNRGANGIDGLISSGIGAARRQPAAPPGSSPATWASTTT